jgi:hypothetical protein
MHNIVELCENIMEHFDNSDAKQNFKAKLKGKHEYAAMAEADIQVCKTELKNYDNWFDGRCFRDYAEFYDIQISEDGKTDRVIDWLEWNVECDDYHWFQRDNV